MKKLMLLILFALILAGCGSDEVETEEKPVSVRVYKLHPDSISSSLKLTGSITAVNDAIVFSRVSEEVKDIKVETGKNVSEGEILAIQKNDMLKQGVDAAEAGLKNAKAQLNLVKNDFERMQRLYEQKAISQQQFDQTETQLQAAESAVDQFEAQTSQAREQYQNSFLKAPFAGKVAAIYIEEDQMLPAGQPAFQLINSKGMKAKVLAPSGDIGKIKKGMNVKISIPAIPDKTFYGVVYDLDESIDPVTKSAEAEIRIKNPGTEIRSGMFGQFEIETLQETETIVIPDNAVLTQTEVKQNEETGELDPIKKSYVFKVSDNRAMLQEIKTGISGGDRIEVLSGLNFSDTIIVVGQNIVKNDQLIKVVD